MAKNESEVRSPAWRTAGRPPRNPHRVVVEIGRLGPKFDFGGGHVVLDFNNTAAWPSRGSSNDRVTSPGTLILWAAEAKLISHRESMLIAAERGCQPSADVVAKFNQHLRKAGKSLDHEWLDGHLEWQPTPAKNLTSIVERIAWRAREFFALGDFARLRCCANPACGWFFIDRSRNSSRRWCMMRECGDRAKSKRYYGKKHETV